MIKDSVELNRIHGDVADMRPRQLLAPLNDCAIYAQLHTTFIGAFESPTKL